ncbi:hypothetical protein TVAG_512770 [Trichomonas vaginalis G3]|uniref:Uncharacterized protein n=1 Tax=Trichomonas vaginalis (strain ATCC PRA-98 / G3) TaxID=412133 RepID=A2GA85_TRIV3|nr:hypothetical protein TVAGG3_0060780 [Trichomonas vaginalis G3]EAX85931.1 hypothetical protein TVAG_512770 [Trichomonas vaginalis G3]KAI5541989.1 hypothetical protein TVAGG3_0060780 [Trichomonas vaginalis G3]|eukprot:XP_001298861.1 hypothetical protein [Trichomonas vaginalis G3]
MIKVESLVWTLFLRNSYRHLPKFANTSSCSIYFSYEWNEFYARDLSNTPYENNSSKLSPGDQNYYVKSCLFSENINSGAINFTTKQDTTKLLVDETQFLNCSNSGQGGSLYFSSEGECVQDRIISDSSKVTTTYTYGVYCYSDVSDKESFQNKILSSSITKSGENNLGDVNIYLKNGKINFTNSNISHSKCKGISVSCFESYLSDSKVLFSIFYDNKDKPPSDAASVYLFYSPSSTILFEATNFQNITDFCLVYAYKSPTNLTNCCFSNNKISQYYFYGDSAKITVDRCFIDEVDPKTTYTVEITNRIQYLSNIDVCEISYALGYQNINKFNKEYFENIEKARKYINFSNISTNFINFTLNT